MKKNRIKYELSIIKKIDGGEYAFLETANFIKKLKKLCRSVRKDYDPGITFRGPALSSICAYLLGITEVDPVRNRFPSWAFFVGHKEIMFNINLPYAAYSLLLDYGLEIPACVKLFYNRDITHYRQDNLYCQPSFQGAGTDLFTEKGVEGRLCLKKSSCFTILTCDIVMIA